MGKGGKEKTASGLTKANLTKSKSGKIVTKTQSASAKKRYAGSKARAWAKACSKARKELNIKGFVPFGGKTAAGKALLAKVRAIYKGARGTRQWGDNSDCLQVLKVGRAIGQVQI